MGTFPDMQLTMCEGNFVRKQVEEEGSIFSYPNKYKREEIYIKRAV